MTPSEVADRLEEAMDVLRRMPTDRPHGYKVAWPDIVQAYSESYGYNPTQLREGYPDPAAISRMDEALGWIIKLPDSTRKPIRKIVVGRACGVRWVTLERKIGRPRLTIKRWWTEQMVRISKTENKS